jgi:uncharacterized protein (TIGR03067 family)
MREYVLWVWWVLAVGLAVGCRPPTTAPTLPPQPVLPGTDRPPETPVSTVIDPSAADLNALQGWWNLVEDHTQPGETAGPPYQLLIEGNRAYQFSLYGIQAKDICICIRLDATQTPKHMDRWHVKENDGHFSRAIYRLEGDELTEVYGSDEPDGRPSQFDDPNTLYRKFRRCVAPKTVRLTGDEECQPKLTPPGTPADIKRW